MQLSDQDWINQKCSLNPARHFERKRGRAGLRSAARRYTAFALQTLYLSTP
jgi:hypothetical protein